MSPVSPVLSLQQQQHNKINCLTLFQLLFWKTRKGADRFPDLGLVLILIITENRIRRTSGPVHENKDSVHIKAPTCILSL